MSDDQHPQVTQAIDGNALKVALMENNIVINKAIEASGEKISRSVNSTVSGFVNTVSTLSSEQAKLHGEVASLTVEVRTKLSNIWGKITGVVAVVSIISLIIGYNIGKLLK
jgi:hypothetical protein